VVFLGDYIDRGPSAPATLELMLAFEQRVIVRPNSAVTFLCGNHDEYFSRVLTHRGLIDTPLPGHPKPRDLAYTGSTPKGELHINGVETWLFIGGGITTLRDYGQVWDETLFDRTQKSFRRDHPEFSLARIEEDLGRAIAAIPAAHRAFFGRSRKVRYAIVGDYLMTHAGIDPARPLAQQGIGPEAPMLEGKALVDFLMIRNPFLWQESLPHCPYVVVHGHTPSDITAADNLIADAQKDYRLCVDTATYADNGALTCFMRKGDAAYFMAVNQAQPEYVSRYSIPPLGQATARQFHEVYYPRYHQ
jgi:hypothetical protein